MSHAPRVERSPSDDAEPGGRSNLHRAVLRFAALSIVALVVVGVVAVMVSQRVAEEEARSDAAGRAQSLAWGVAAPNVDRGVRLGRPRALERLGAALQQRIEEGTVAHVVLWDRDGRVIWADANWLIGESHQLSGGAAEAFTTMSSVAHLPDERSENEEGLYAGKDMLEVYVAARDLNDEPFVFEAYLSSDRIDQDRAAVLPRLLMVTLGSLALFQLAVLPLAVSLARRVDEAQGARARMLRRSLASWHHQRRRLAQELHDGPIQELTAIGYGVSLLSDGPSDPRQNRTISDTLRGSVSRAEESLRSLVMDLTPRSFAGDEMRMALAELVTDLQQKGTHVELQLTVDDTVPEATGGLVYRVVREALRNVEKHAAADHVLVAVRQGDGGLYVRVHDDGVGVAGGDALLRGQGLRLLTGALEDAGGTLYVGQGDPSGTELAAWVPLLDDDLGRP